MSIRKLANNKYKISVELGYDVLGKRKRKTEVINGTKSDALMREAELTRDFYHVGHTTNINDLTVEEFSKMFLDKYCCNIGLITKQNYEKLFKRILLYIGKVKMNKVTPFIIDSMYQKLKHGEKKQEVGYHTMYSYYKLINVMFNQAIKWELLDKNPNHKATKPKKEKKESKYYDLAQVNKLLQCLDNECLKWKALIILTLDSGARRGEIIGLRWGDISFDNNTMKIERSLKVAYGIVDESKTKTISSQRTIVLSNSTIEILKEYKKEQEQYISSLGKLWKGSDRVFISKYGENMYPTTPWQILQKIIKKYDLEPISYHNLRHTSASILIHKGINPKAVSQRLGHADTSVTMEIYSHAFEDTKIASAIVFDEVLKRP